jgi:hypothetical protein
MRDPWTEKLSEYVDGELAAGDAAALEAHLGSCTVCSDAVAELRAVVAAARTLTDTPPQNDLWAGIAAGIAAGAPERGVMPFRRGRAAVPQRLSFSMPQLAAAALVLMTLSGGAVWLLQRPAAPGIAGTIVHSAAPDAAARLVGSEPVTGDVAYDRDVVELEQLLAEHRDRLDPATIEVIERSMDSIDRAIEDARAALQADPANPHLHRQLDSTMRKKVALLRRATRGAS